MKERSMMLEAQQLRTVDEIQGSSFLAIRNALVASGHYNLDLSQYKILVLTNGNSKAVVFTDRNEPGNIRKDFGVQLGSKAELGIDDLRTLLSNLGRHEVVDTLQGSSVEPIQAALEAFQRHNQDLSLYKVAVVHEKTSIIVIFTDRDAKKGARGNPGVRPGFEVELNARDLHIVRANFIR